MREDSIVRFLMLLGVERSSIEVARGWVNCPCPLSPWSHKGGQDTRPSFGIRVDDSGPSFFYCFGCTPQGRRIDRLLHNMFIMSGRYPHRAAEIYTWEENHEPEETDEFPTPKEVLWDEPEKVYSPLPYEVINQYPMLQYSKGEAVNACLRYLEEERLIESWTANYFKVRYDPVYRTLIFPLTDMRGRIFLMRARSWSEKRIWTISPKAAGFPLLEFPRLREVGAWFGLWAVDWRKPVIALEAEMDVLRLATLGVFNVVASATSSVTEAQIDNLGAARRLILGYDADKAGEHAEKRFVDRLGGKTSLYRLDWELAERHPKFVKDDASACKDAGDLKDFDELQKVLTSIREV